MDSDSIWIKCSDSMWLRRYVGKDMMYCGQPK